MTPDRLPPAYRYMVTVEPGVSIRPRRFVRVIELDGPRPAEAVCRTLDEVADPAGLWQSDDFKVRCERVA